MQHFAVLSPVPAQSCVSVLGFRCAPLLQEEALLCYCRGCSADSVLEKKPGYSAVVFTYLRPSERSSTWTAGDVLCRGERVSWRELWCCCSVSCCISDAGDVAEVGLYCVLPWPILNIMTSGPLPKSPELDRVQKRSQTWEKKNTIRQYQGVLHFRLLSIFWHWLALHFAEVTLCTSVFFLSDEKRCSVVIGKTSRQRQGWNKKDVGVVHCHVRKFLPCPGHVLDVSGPGDKVGRIAEGSDRAGAQWVVRWGLLGDAWFVFVVLVLLAEHCCIWVLRCALGFCILVLHTCVYVHKDVCSWSQLFW